MFTANDSSHSLSCSKGKSRFNEARIQIFDGSGLKSVEFTTVWFRYGSSEYDNGVDRAYALKHSLKKRGSRYAELLQLSSLIVITVIHKALLSLTRRWLVVQHFFVQFMMMAITKLLTVRILSNLMNLPFLMQVDRKGFVSDVLASIYVSIAGLMTRVHCVVGLNRHHVLMCRSEVKLLHLLSVMRPSLSLANCLRFMMCYVQDFYTYNSDSIHRRREDGMGENSKMRF